MPESLYRIEVAPNVILPLERSPFFSYASPKSIPLGSLVRIPFGRREIDGIVYACDPLPGKQPSWMKSVARTEEAAFLTDGQRELALFVSEEYFTPLGRVLKHFLPKRPKTRKDPGKKTGKNPAVRTLAAEKKLLEAWKKLSAKKPIFFDTASVPGPDRLLLLLAKETAPKQTLILVPEITLIRKFEAQAEKVFAKEKIAVLNSQVPLVAFFDAWERIRDGRASVVIATRQGLFAPFKNLGCVIIAEEQDDAYKQWDMSPRYHGKVVAEALARILKAKLVLATATPSTESILGLREKEIAVIGKRPLHPPLENKLTFINLKLERFRKNYSPLSEALVNSLHSALGRKKQALLYINRQGMSAFSVCESCKHIFRCPESGHALVNTPDGHFQCLGCSYKTGLFPSCPECGGLTFRHIGFGAERIEKEVKRLFPGARVFRADGSTMKKAGQTELLYGDGMAGKIDILVGTQMVIKDPPLPNLGLVAMIDADSLLSWPDFRSDERLFQHLSRFSHLVGSRAGGEVLVQTFHPEATFFQRVAGLSEKDFYTKALSEREDLFYPPYARLISLNCQDKDEEKLSARMEELAQKLDDLKMKRSELRWNILEASRYLKRQKVFESSLLIRIPRGIPLPPSLQSFLRQANKTCVIDIDPLTFS